MAKRKKSSQSIFKDLDRLFRGKPLVRRKIRPNDTRLAMPDKQSSGMAFFQKSVAPTYANITSVAYNISERLVRYQDFQEMEQCVAGDTLIATPESPTGFMRIDELADLCKIDPDRTFIVYAYDHEKKSVMPTLGKQARKTTTDHAWKIKFDSGKEIIASEDHRLMLHDGVYCEVNNLQIGDYLMRFCDDFDFCCKDNQEQIEEFKVYLQSTKKTNIIRKDVTFNKLLEVCDRTGFYKENLIKAFDVEESTIIDLLNEQGFKSFETFIKAYDNKSRKSVDHNKKKYCSESNRIISIEYVGVIDLFDLTVDGYKNFATDSVISHNTPELSKALDVYCLAGDNIIPMLSGDKKSVKDLYDSKVENFWVYSFDIENQKYVPGMCTKVVKTGTDQKIFRVLLNDESFVRLTENHLVLLSLGEYRKVKDLKINDSIRSIYTRQSSIEKCDKNEFDFLSCTNQSVKSIELDGCEDVYDLKVEKWHNFAVGIGSESSYVIVHNSDETVSQDDKGQVLHIHSDDKKIEELLSDLFYGTLNTDYLLRPCARNLVKYGDVFYYIDISPTYGVQNLIPLPVNEIEREENFDPKDPFSVRFRWIAQNREISNWEVAHFRLIGNDLFLPYGSSVLEAARRIWRQLILIEDAMLVYRIVRAPERRVFYIDVANIHPNDVDHYVEETRRRLRTNQVIDRDQGRVDLRYNSFCFRGNTKVPLLDGRDIEIKSLVEEWNNGNRDVEVYSVDHENGGSIVPGKIIWAGKSGSTKEFTRLTLDDNTVVEVTPDHKMMLRNGDPVKAKDLVVGDSLMPAYFKHEKVGRSLFEFGKFKKEIIGKSRVTKKSFVWNENCRQHAIRVLKTQYKKPTVDEFLKLLKEDVKFADEYTLINSGRDVCLSKSFTRKGHILKSLLKEYKGFNAFVSVHCPRLLGREFVNNVDETMIVQEGKNNHKVINIETVYVDDEDVYNVTVDKYHNLAVGGLNSSRVKHENDDCFVNTGFVYSFQSVDEDFLIPVRGQDSATRIDTLAGGQNTAAVEDVEYIQKKMFAAIGIPRAYLGFDDMLSCLTAEGKVKLLDGRVVTIKMLSDHFLAKQSNKLENLLSENDLYVYSSDNKGRIRPGKLVNTWKTRETNELYHVQIDDVGEIICTGNHPFMCRDGSYVRADQLVAGQSLMPMNKEDENLMYFVSSVIIENLEEQISVYDLEVEKYNNFAALLEPFDGIKSSSDKDQGSFIFLHNSKATLAQEDIRFSRTVTSIQKVIISELNKIAMIHLYVNGYRNMDLTNFKLMLSNPSTIAQQQKLELISAKFDIAANAPEAIVDREYVQREVFGFTDDEIERIRKGRKTDRVEDAYLESIAAGEEGGGGGGGGGDLFGSGGGGGEADFGGEDLGGDEVDVGGSEDIGSGEESGGGEEEELEAGDDHVDDSDEDDDDLELLLSADYQGDPISPNSTVERDRYNKSRRKKGPKGSMPDFLRNLNRKDKQDDPYDSGWLKNAHKNESVIFFKPKLDSYTNNMLKKMGANLSLPSGNQSITSAILTEEVNPDDNIFVTDDDSDEND